MGYLKFESNVIYIGTKTSAIMVTSVIEFESNVIYIGTKTENALVKKALGLRVM